VQRAHEGRERGQVTTELALLLLLAGLGVGAVAATGHSVHSAAKATPIQHNAGQTPSGTYQKAWSTTTWATPTQQGDVVTSPFTNQKWVATYDVGSNAMLGQPALVSESTGQNQINIKPNAVISPASVNIYTGTLQTFQDLSTSPAGTTLVGNSWGNMQVVTPSVSYSYPNAGTYTVPLTVKDEYNLQLPNGKSYTFYDEASTSATVDVTVDPCGNPFANP